MKDHPVVREGTGISSGRELSWPTRRRFITGSLGLALPAVYGISAYGLSSSLDNLEITAELPIKISNLPRALDGLRVVQISDIHVGPYLRKRELEGIVGQVNALRPDLVVIKGDLIVPTSGCGIPQQYA